MVSTATAVTEKRVENNETYIQWTHFKCHANWRRKLSILVNMIWNRYSLERNCRIQSHIYREHIIKFNKSIKSRMKTWTCSYLVEIANNFIKQPQTFQPLFINIGLIVEFLVIWYWSKHNRNAWISFVV